MAATGDIGWFGFDDGSGNRIDRKAEVIHVFHPTPSTTVLYVHVHVCSADDAMLTTSEQITNQPARLDGTPSISLVVERQCADAGSTPTIGAFWQ